jgi:hypothetical protein
VVALCITAIGMMALAKGIDHGIIAAVATVLGWTLGIKGRGFRE